MTVWKIWKLWKSKTRKPQLCKAQLGLELLEDRLTPSGGLPIFGGSPGAAGSQGATGIIGQLPGNGSGGGVIGPLPGNGAPPFFWPGGNPGGVLPGSGAGVGLNGGGTGSDGNGGGGTITTTTITKGGVTTTTTTDTFNIGGTTTVDISLVSTQVNGDLLASYYEIELKIAVPVQFLGQQQTTSQPGTAQLPLVGFVYETWVFPNPGFFRYSDGIQLPSQNGLDPLQDDLGLQAQQFDTGIKDDNGTLSSYVFVSSTNQPAVSDQTVDPTVGNNPGSPDGATQAPSDAFFTSVGIMGMPLYSF